MSGKIGRLVRSLVEAQEELNHQQKLQEEEVVDVEEVVVEPAWDLLAVLRGAVALAEDDTIETTVDTNGELSFIFGGGGRGCQVLHKYSRLHHERCIV